MLPSPSLEKSEHVLFAVNTLLLADRTSAVSTWLETNGATALSYDNNRNLKGLRAHHAPPEYVQHIIDAAITNNERAETPNEETGSKIAEQTQAINDLR